MKPWKALLLFGTAVALLAAARGPAVSASRAQELASSADPPGPRSVRKAADYFDAPFLRRSEEYNRTRLFYGLNAQAIRWAVYLTLVLSPFLPDVGRRLVRRFPRHPGVRVFLLGWLVLSILFVAVLPISYAAGFRLEHGYGLSRQSLGSWIGDHLKWLGLWGSFLTIASVGYFTLRRRFPRRGWMLMAGALAIATVAVTLVYPVVIDPLFNRFKRLEDAPLERDLVSMARREGIVLERVLVMEASAKTVRENAYFTGLGRTKRVVLWDNLLANASPGEIRQVFAHELGHWSRGHIARGLGLSLAAIPLLCWLIWRLHERLAGRLGRLQGVTDPAGVALVWLLLSVILFVSRPLSNAVSRSFEREADRVSLELTNDPETLIANERRLTLSNLGWVDPPAIWQLLFGSHPTTLERIRMAERWRETS